jgi:hypothetical protein
MPDISAPALNALEQAARVLTLANDTRLPGDVRDAASDITANLITVANEVR